MDMKWSGSGIFLGGRRSKASRKFGAQSVLTVVDFAGVGKRYSAFIHTEILLPF